VLEVDQVTKIYPPVRGILRVLMRTASNRPVSALREVSLRVEPGEVVGVVGPNGAGKTTLFRIIATLLDPTSGRVRVDGHDVVSHPDVVRGHFGLLLEGERGLYGRLTGLENLEFFGVMQGMTSSDARGRGEELLGMLGLAYPHHRVFGYSAGMRVRLAIARALIADPPLLLLDEPTRSLDPKASVHAMEMVGELAATGRAVLLASHRLDEVRAVCNRAVVLHEGQVRFDGSPHVTDLIGLMGEEVR
jgi:ABC-2 type transport system ATP-binding protein